MPSGVYEHKKLPLKDRLIGRYAIRDSGCWEWTASKNPKGYGQLSMGAGKSPVHASRVSFIVHRGEIPDGMEVCHTCDNPACINPDHLFLGTHAENMRDCSVKGRVANRKLCEADVLAIRDLHGRGAAIRAIARTYKINRTTTKQVITRKTWKHI